MGGMNETTQTQERPPQRRRTSEQCREQLEIYRRSGLKPIEYCRQHGLAYTTLMGWIGSERNKKRLRKKSGVKFQRVRISPRVGLGDGMVAEVCLPSGARVRVLRGCGREELEMILSVAV